MRILSDLEKIAEDKFYFYQIFREFVIEFDSYKEMKDWVRTQEEKDKCFGYDGYWTKNGKEARKHFNLQHS